MPRYFFSTRIAADLVEDPTGTELRDADHAWQTARDTILATLREGPDQSRLMSAVLVVTDDEGEVVLEFPFSEAAAIEPRSRHSLH